MDTPVHHPKQEHWDEAETNSQRHQQAGHGGNDAKKGENKSEEIN
jgi:hypothetical protein